MKTKFTQHVGRDMDNDSSVFECKFAVIAVLLVVVGLAGPTTTNSTATTKL
jgi:hypothetical protein